MKKIILSVFIFTAVAGSTRANVVLSDSFSYSDGAIVGAVNSPWESHSGTAGTMVVSNSMLRIAGTAAISEDVNAPLQGAPYTTNSPTVLYASFKLVATNAPPGLGAYFAHFKDNNSGAATGFGARIYAASTNVIAGTTPAAGKYRVSIMNGAYFALGSQNVSDSFQIDQDLDVGVVYTIVSRFDPSNGVASIWLNPNDESDPKVDAADPGTLTRPNPIDVYAYAFRQTTGEGAMFVDNLKVGTHFYDVAGTNTPPLISSIADQSIPANGATPALDFTVQDDNTAAGSLTLSHGSTNTTLVPNDDAHITIAGSGTNRTVTVTPVTGQQGATTITINVSDPTYTSSIPFQVTVGAPAISSIGNQITISNTPTSAIAFTVGDSESAASSLTLSSASSNTNLVTTNNIVFGGSASNRTVTITPQPNQIGLATITVTVSDGANTTSTSFKLTVRPLIGVVLTERFDYSTFSGSITNSLYGADNSPWVHVSGSFFEVLVTNGAGRLSITNTEDVGVGLTNGPFATTNGVVLYAGFTVKASLLPLTFGSYFAHFKDTAAGTSTFLGRVFTGTTNAASGLYRLGIANTSAALNTQYARDLSLNTTYIVVVRYNSATAQTWLWVNPVNESSSNVLATDTATASSIGGFGLREDTGIGRLDVDDLVVGTSFASVLPSVGTGNLHIQIAGDDAVLSWTNKFFGLESAPAVTGPYTLVPDASSPYTNAISGGVKYFRLVY